MEKEPKNREIYRGTLPQKKEVWLLWTEGCTAKQIAGRSQPSPAVSTIYLWVKEFKNLSPQRLLAIYEENGPPDLIIDKWKSYHIDYPEMIREIDELSVIQGQQRKPERVQVEKQPYEETPHKQKMRELAGKLIGEIVLPGITSSFIVELRPQRFSYVDSSGHGRCLTVTVDEKKKISVEISIQSEGEIDYLHKGLRSHLKNGGFSQVLDEIENWSYGVADNLLKCHGLFTLVTEELKKSYNVSIPMRDEKQPGFTMGFPKLICTDAIEQARGSFDYRDFPYSYDGLNLRFGTNIIYKGIVNQDLKPYEDAHKKLRVKYAGSEQARAIANEREGLSRMVAPITEQLRKFIDMEHLPGQCELCS